MPTTASSTANAANATSTIVPIAARRHFLVEDVGQQPDVRHGQRGIHGMDLAA